MPKKMTTSLIGAGAFSLALAVALPLAIAPALMKAPATEDVTTHSRSAAQKLNSATGKLEPITVDLTRRLKTETDAKGKYVGSGKVAVYHELLSLAVVGADGSVQSVDARGRYSGLRAGESTIAFNRATGAGVKGQFGETWNTTAQTVKFPFNVQKKTYEYYDQTSRRGWPVAYDSTTKIDGLEVYVFKGTIPETSLGQYGVLEGTDTLYSNKGRTVYVEPVTGSIVSSETAPQTSIKFATGTVSPALLVDNLIPTEETIADRVTFSKGIKSKVLLLKRSPWVLGALGLLLLAGGGLLGRRRTAVVTPQGSRPDVSGGLPTPRREPAADRKPVKS